MNAETDQAKEFSRWIALGLIQPIIAGNVSCQFEIDEKGVLFWAEVAENDKGAVIGRRGEVSDAIRLLVREAGIRQGIRASFKIR